MVIFYFNAANATDSFDFKPKINGQTGINGRKEIEIMALKYFRNFCRTLEMSLINCELILFWLGMQTVL